MTAEHIRVRCVYAEKSARICFNLKDDKINGKTRSLKGADDESVDSN